MGLVYVEIMKNKNYAMEKKTKYSLHIRKTNQNEIATENPTKHTYNDVIWLDDGVNSKSA